MLDHERRKPHPEPSPLVLVVDDDASARTAMREILTDYGYAVAVADNGATAMALARETPPDLVISDVRMPHIDGFELASQLRARTGDEDYIPIILVSAHGETERRVAGLDVGADDFLTKPIDVDELLARVRAHLRNASRHRALVQRTQRDELTGAMSRDRIVRELEEHMARYHHTGVALSVVVLDVLVTAASEREPASVTSDADLHRIAASLREHVRDNDLVGRYDRGEFLVVLPGVNGIEAARVAVRLRQITTVGAETAESSLELVVSAGSAAALPTDTATTLVNRADQAMYHSRRGQAGPAYQQRSVQQ